MSSTDDGHLFLGMSVESSDALPACDRAQQGRIVYVAAEKSFLACGETGQWRADKQASQDAWQKAFALYKKYRAGIIRIATQCEDRGGVKSTFVGTGFHCASGIVCTDRRVLECPDGAAPVRINLHHTAAGEDRDDESATEMPPPFYTVTDRTLAESQITRHPSRNLAKLRLPADVVTTSDLPVLSWHQSALNPDAPARAYTLSISYPLGFTAPYAQLGSLDNGRMYEFSTTNDSDSGSYGSPLIDLEGHVIGVVVQAPADTPNDTPTDTPADTPGQTPAGRAGTVPGSWAIDASLLSAF